MRCLVAAGALMPGLLAARSHCVRNQGNPIGCFISDARSLSDHPMPLVMLFVDAGLPSRLPSKTMQDKLFANREAGPAQELRHLRDVTRRYGVRLRE